MPRSIWKGSISFGLVQIPVGLYLAESRDEISFSQLDRRDMSPIRYERVNRQTGKPVSWDDIVRGYEYEEGQYVVMTDEDLRRANVEATQTVDIVDFVDASDIAPVYFDKPYYLAPVQQKKKRAPSKAYVLLREALKQTGKVGIAKVVIRTREHIAALMPHGNVLVLNLLRFAHELVGEEALELPTQELAGESITQKELEMAKRLVIEMAVDWEPEKYKDEYRDDLMKLIEKRVKAGELQGSTEPSLEQRRRRTGNVDIIALLKKSLADKKAGGGRGHKGIEAEAKRGDKTSAQKGGGPRRAA